VNSFDCKFSLYDRVKTVREGRTGKIIAILLTPKTTATASSVQIKYQVTHDTGNTFDRWYTENELIGIPNVEADTSQWVDKVVIDAYLDNRNFDGIKNILEGEQQYARKHYKGLCTSKPRRS